MRAIGTQLDWTTLLDDHDVNAPIEMPGFPKKMDGEERTTRPTTDYGNAVAVLEAPKVGRCAAPGKSPLRHKRSIPC